MEKKEKEREAVGHLNAALELPRREIEAQLGSAYLAEPPVGWLVSGQRDIRYSLVVPSTASLVRTSPAGVAKPASIHTWQSRDWRWSHRSRSCSTARL